MKRLMTMVLLFIMIMTGAMAQAVKFTTYDEDDCLHYCIWVDGKKYFADSSFGFAEGLGDCMRLEIECEKDLEVWENAYIVLDIYYFLNYLTVLDEDLLAKPEWYTCECPLVQKGREGGKTILYFAVSDDFLTEWVKMEYRESVAYENECVGISSIVLTDKDLLMYGACWGRDREEPKEKEVKEYLEGEEYNKIASLRLSRGNFTGRFGEEVEKILEDYSDFTGLEAGLFRAKYKNYGAGIYLSMLLPASYNIDTTAIVKLSVEMDSGETKEVEARIMSNDKGAIWRKYPQVQYKYGYCFDGDSVYLHSPDMTPMAKIKNKWKKYETISKMIAENHPEKSGTYTCVWYWKEEMSNFEKWKTKYKRYAGWDHLEEDVVDSCVVANEACMYFDLKEEDMDVLMSAKIIERIELRQDNGDWLIYAKKEEK